MTKKTEDIGSRMAIIETNLTYIKEGMDENKTQHQEIIDKLDCHISYITKQLDEKEKEYDQKYANKYTENIVYGIVGIILTVLMYAIANYFIH